MISLLLAACGSATPTRPITTAAPTLPVITLAPTATPAATEAPATCRPNDASPTGTLRIRALDGDGSMELGPIDALPTLAPAPTASEPAPTLDPDLIVDATLLGGTDLEVSVDVESAFDGDSVTITSLSGEFVPIGGPARPLEATIGDGDAAIRLPDVDATGSLRVTAAWATACGTGDGAGQLTIAVVDSSIAAGCPTTDEGFFDLLTDLAPATVTYDTITVPLGVTGWSGRWFEANGVDDFPQFSGWDPDAGIVVAPGASIVLRESVDGLALVSVRAGIYLRDEVEAYIEPGSSTELNVYDVQRRSAGPLGRIGIPAPLEPGRYVFEVQGEAQTSCLDLDTYEVISVEVR